MKKLDYTVKEEAPGVWSINEYDMDYMYLIEGKDRAILIDTGTGTGNLKQLVESITSLPYRVILTHGHVDHAGGICQWREIWMHPDDIPPILENASHDGGAINTYNRRRYAKFGLALHGSDALPWNLESFKPVDASKVVFFSLREGDKIDLGGRIIEVFELPGHSKGSLCFLDRSGRNLFVGDAVVRMQLLNGNDPDKVQFENWLEGAIRIRSWMNEADRMFGGHESPIDISVFEDQITCAKLVIEDKLQEEYCEVNEYCGWMYHYKDIWFTLRRENLLGRNYSRIVEKRAKEAGLLADQDLVRLTSPERI